MNFEASKIKALDVSIIIPTLDDNSALESLLQQIRGWKSQPKEIIVVDAVADKNCEAICKTYSARWLSFKKNRGAQQKFGATHATGETLWFLHADAKPHPEALDYISSEVSIGSHGGFFRFQFDSGKTTHTQKILTFFTNWRSKHFTAYGDQGIFIKKDFYKNCGGHADQPLFEEVQLIKAIRESGKLSVSKLPIKVSTRRWERDGYWMRTINNRKLAIAYRFGASADSLAKSYNRKTTTNNV